MKRTSETWSVRYQTPPSTNLATYLIRKSDDSVHGPFGSLTSAEDYVGRSGGGYLDWGSSANLIPNRGSEGQIALLHYLNGIGWWDWHRCEERPRAFVGCGHGGVR